MEYRNDFSQTNNSSRTNSAYRNSQSLFLDVLDDNARWAQRAVVQTSEQEKDQSWSTNFNIFGTKSEPVQTPTPFANMISNGNVLGLDRSLPAYDIIVAGAEQKKENGGGSFLGIRGNYIVYILQTTRLRDCTVALVQKRYKVIRAFFEQLMEQGVIPRHVGPAFPPKETVGHNNDPNGAFVARRRLELQAYMQRLFSAMPTLWSNSDVKDFFALDTLRYGARYTAPKIDLPQAEESGWKPITMAKQAAADLATKIGIGESKDTEQHIEANPYMVRQLCEMGFPEEQVRFALEASKNNPELATEIIMSGNAVQPIRDANPSLRGSAEAPKASKDALGSLPSYEKSSLNRHDWLSLPPPPAPNQTTAEVKPVDRASGTFISQSNSNGYRGGRIGYQRGANDGKKGVNDGYRYDGKGATNGSNGSGTVDV